MRGIVRQLPALCVYVPALQGSACKCVCVCDWQPWCHSKTTCLRLCAACGCLPAVCVHAKRCTAVQGQSHAGKGLCLEWAACRLENRLLQNDKATGCGKLMMRWLHARAARAQKTLHAAALALLV